MSVDKLLLRNVEQAPLGLTRSEGHIPRQHSITKPATHIAHAKTRWDMATAYEVVKRGRRLVPASRTTENNGEGGKFSPAVWFGLVWGNEPRVGRIVSPIPDPPDRISWLPSSERRGCQGCRYVTPLHPCNMAGIWDPPRTIIFFFPSSFSLAAALLPLRKWEGLRRETGMANEERAVCSVLEVFGEFDSNSKQKAELN